MKQQNQFSVIQELWTRASIFISSFSDISPATVEVTNPTWQQNKGKTKGSALYM